MIIFLWFQVFTPHDNPSSQFGTISFQTHWVRWQSMEQKLDLVPRSPWKVVSGFRNTTFFLIKWAGISRISLKKSRKVCDKYLFALWLRLQPLCEGCSLTPQSPPWKGDLGRSPPHWLAALVSFLFFLFQGCNCCCPPSRNWMTTIVPIVLRLSLFYKHF